MTMLFRFLKSLLKPEVRLTIIISFIGSSLLAFLCCYQYIGFATSIKGLGGALITGNLPLLWLLFFPLLLLVILLCALSSGFLISTIFYLGRQLVFFWRNYLNGQDVLYTLPVLKEFYFYRFWTPDQKREFMDAKLQAVAESKNCTVEELLAHGSGEALEKSCLQRMTRQDIEQRVQEFCDFSQPGPSQLTVPDDLLLSIYEMAAAHPYLAASLSIVLTGFVVAVVIWKQRLPPNDGGGGDSNGPGLQDPPIADALQDRPVADALRDAATAALRQQPPAAPGKAVQMANADSVRLVEELMANTDPAKLLEEVMAQDPNAAAALLLCYAIYSIVQDRGPI